MAVRLARDMTMISTVNAFPFLRNRVVILTECHYLLLQVALNCVLRLDLVSLISSCRILGMAKFAVADGCHVLVVTVSVEELETRSQKSHDCHFDFVLCHTLLGEHKLESSSWSQVVWLDLLNPEEYH